MTAPALFPVSLDGVDYMVDVGQYGRRTVELARQQGDSGREFGEQSINPQDLWRRSQSDWRQGAGQVWFDKDEPDSFERRRFASSLGIDPWTRGELSLLPDVTARRAGVVEILPVGDRLYSREGNVLAYAESGAGPWVETAAFPAAVTSFCTDGFTIYCVTSSGIYTVTVDVDTPVLFNTLVADKIAWVKGRLMVAAGRDLYNITDPTDTTPPAPITPTALNHEFRWDCFGETGPYILAAGHSGDKALIYRVSVREDGSELGAPVVAAPLPDGEFVNCITGYVGVVLLGTSKGFRVAPGNQATIDYGGVAPIPGGVSCFEPQDNFVWFGWTNVDASHTGLGRIDLSSFVRELLPPYATDLQAPTQGSVTSVCTFGGKRLFTVGGVGLFEQADGLVASGFLWTGRVTFGLPDRKVFEFLQVRHAPLPSGAGVLWVAAVDGSVVASGATGTPTGGEGSFGAIAGDEATVRVTLTRGVDATQGPRVTRVTLRANPAVSRCEEFVVPIELHPKVQGWNGRVFHYDVREEFLRLQALKDAGVPVIFSEWGSEHSVYVEGVQLGPGLQLTPDRGYVQGTVTLQLKKYPGV